MSNLADTIIKLYLDLKSHQIDDAFILSSDFESYIEQTSPDLLKNTSPNQLITIVPDLYHKSAGKLTMCDVRSLVVSTTRLCFRAQIDPDIRYAIFYIAVKNKTILDEHIHTTYYNIYSILANAIRVLKSHNDRARYLYLARDLMPAILIRYYDVVMQDVALNFVCDIYDFYANSTDCSHYIPYRPVPMKIDVFLYISSGYNDLHDRIMEYLIQYYDVDTIIVTVVDPNGTNWFIEWRCARWIDEAFYTAKYDLHRKMPMIGIGNRPRYSKFDSMHVYRRHV